MMTKVSLLVGTIFLIFAPSHGQSVRQVPGADLVVRKGSSLWREEKCDYDAGRKTYDCAYLRFYADGTVIGVTSEGNPNEIKGWFRKPYKDSGLYQIDGSHIRFSLSTELGIVDYEGEISRHSIRLNEISHINGYHGHTKFVWIHPRRRLRNSR
jgi:hypothetical protein